MIKKYFTILIFTLLHYSGVTQVFTSSTIKQIEPKRLKINTLNYEQGLQSNTIHNIITDSKGFIWVATETGLQRNNGYNFETINPIIDKKIIEINHAVFLFQLENNCIWISTKEGIIEFNPEKQNYKYVIKNKSSNKNYSLIPIKETTAEIWLIDDEKGICTFQKATGVIEIVFNNLPADFLKDLQKQQVVDNFNRIQIPFCTINAEIYIASYTHLLKLNVKSRKYSILKKPFTYIFALENKGNELLVTTTDKIIILNTTTEEIEQEINYTNFTKNRNVKAILRKTKNSYLLALNNELFELDTTFKTFKQCVNINNGPLINVGFINVIYADALNRIWLITNNDLKRIQFSPLPFKHLFYPSAKNNFVKSIYYNERNHQILAGTYGNGLQVYDSIGNNLLKKPFQTDAIKDIMNIMELRNNNYLITPYFNKWQSVNLNTNKITPITINPLLDNLLGSTTVNFVNNIKMINENNFIIGTSKNIFICKIENNTLIDASPIFNFLPNNDNYLSFLKTTKNTIWTGSISGSLFFKETNGTIRQIENIGNYFIRSACEDSTGNIWIGTTKGLHLFTPHGKLLKTFSTANGLRNDCIYAILPVEKKATVFVSTNLGLAQIDAEGSIKIYSKEIGLQENEFNTGAAFKNQSGKLFFGGVNGITAFNPNDLNEVETNLQIHLSRFVVNDSVYYYPSRIWNNDTINLLNYENHLQFDIVANGLLNAEEYDYQYRISGFEQNWQFTNKPINIRYTLEPGTYTLEIVCIPILSNGKRFTKNIIIHIQPAWYQIRWVKVLLFLLALGIVGLFVYQYQRIIYLRKIKELQIQNEIQKDRERISRELHDNLGTQLSYISSNADFMIDIDDKLNNADRKQKLENINSIAKSSIADLRETIWALKKGTISVDELFERIKLYAQTHTDNVLLDYKENVKQSVFLSSVDALNLFRLCQEAITNSMKYAKAKNLSIKLLSDDHFLYHIEIRDDGIGFAIAKISGEHYGVENMSNRAKELNAFFTINSGENKGTTITLYKENQKSV